MKAFRTEDYLWFQIAEYAFDTFMMGRQRRAKRSKTVRGPTKR